MLDNRKPIDKTLIIERLLSLIRLNCVNRKTMKYKFKVLFTHIDDQVLAGDFVWNPTGNVVVPLRGVRVTSWQLILPTIVPFHQKRLLSKISRVTPITPDASISWQIGVSWVGKVDVVGWKEIGCVLYILDGCVLEDFSYRIPRRLHIWDKLSIHGRLKKTFLLPPSSLTQNCAPNILKSCTGRNALTRAYAVKFFPIAPYGKLWKINHNSLRRGPTGPSLLAPAPPKY